MRMIRWVERALVAGGIATLLVCAGLVADAAMAQRRGRDALQRAMHAEGIEVWPGVSALAPPTAGAGGDASPAEPDESRVASGDAVAALSMPRLQLSAVVLHGADAATLRRGPGHLEGTPFPGHRGNVVIAGHRDSFFWPLRHVRLGDDMFLDTPAGAFHYRVASIRIVDPHDLSVLDQTGDEVVTLITCYPFVMVGHAPDRFVVRAVRVSAVTDAAPTAVDDEVQVRETLSRYLRLQQTVSGSRPGSEAAPGDACAITIDEDRAVAQCRGAADAAAGPVANERTFALERADATWAIRSIAVQ